MEYDFNGNVVREVIRTLRVPKFPWDSLNRLIAIQSDKIPVPGSWRTEFAYDGQSRRVGIVEQVRGRLSFAASCHHGHLVLFQGH